MLPAQKLAVFLSQLKLVTAMLVWLTQSNQVVSTVGPVSYSEVVRGGKSDAHSSTKESKEMSISERNYPNPRRNHPNSRRNYPNPRCQRRQRINQSKSREFVGRRKLWGTKREDTAEKVRESAYSRGSLSQLLSRLSVFSGGTLAVLGGGFGWKVKSLLLDEKHSQMYW